MAIGTFLVATQRLSLTNYFHMVTRNRNMSIQLWAVFCLQLFVVSPVLWGSLAETFVEICEVQELTPEGQEPETNRVSDFSSRRIRRAEIAHPVEISASQRLIRKVLANVSGTFRKSSHSFGHFWSNGSCAPRLI